MSRPRQLVDRLPPRTVAAVRRVAVGIGLQQVVALEQAVDDLTEAVEENALLGAGLERRVAELEGSLLTVLVARARGKRVPPRENRPTRNSRG